MKKIEIFVGGKYTCTTTRSKTCAQAVAGYKAAHPSVKGKVTANFKPVKEDMDFDSEGVKESTALGLVNQLFEGENTGGFDTPFDTGDLVGVTTGDTTHGNPGERRLLKGGTRVGLKHATNLPDDSDIKYWVFPLKDHPWEKATAEWAEDVGVGLGDEDVRVDLQLESQYVSKPVKKYDTGEWVVKWMVNGKRDENKTYYTDDEDDAWGTYRHMVQICNSQPERVGDVAVKKARRPFFPPTSYGASNAFHARYGKKTP